MKIVKPLLAAFAGLAISSGVGEAQLSLDCSSVPGSTMQFNGSAHTFQFNPSDLNFFAGIQWLIGSETGGTGSAIGLVGGVDNSPFSYGPITINGAEENAKVAGPSGRLFITDASEVSLTGTVDWYMISTFERSGAINESLNINITDLQYTGSNPDLQILASSGNGSIIFTLQFSPGVPLANLSSGSTTFLTSYSGSLSVPEPSSVALAMLGLIALISVRYFRNAKVSGETNNK